MNINETGDHIASALSQKAYDHLINREYEKALSLYDECLEIFKSGEDNRRLAMTYNNMGLIHVQTGNFSMAMKCFEHAFSHYRALKDSDGQANQLQNMGSVCRDIKDHDKAVEMYLKALAFFEETSITL